MIIETLRLKEIGILPELFLGISLVYFVMHGVFLSISNNKYPLIQTSILYLGVLALLMVCFLFLNDNLNVIEYSIFNNTIANDFLSFSSKILIGIFSIFCLLMIQQHLVGQKINHFEYVLVILFAILGLFLLCSANDLITAYLAIELQSLAFYLLAAFKKNSTFSVDAGLKYFILGAFSSGLFLFGSSLIYGITGSINFEDFKDLFFWVFPGSSVALLNLDEYYYKQDQEILLNVMLNKLSSFEDGRLSEHDFITLFREFVNLEANLKNEAKTDLYHMIYLTIQQKSVNLDLDTLPIFVSENSNMQPSFVKIHGLLELMKNPIGSVVSNVAEKTGTLVGFTDQMMSSELYKALNFFTIVNKIDLFFVQDDFQKKTYFIEPFDSSLLQFALIFILISLFFKLALAPFHLWSPDIYEGSPSSSTFFFAVVPKLSIFVLLLRICYYGFYGFIDNWRYSIVIVSVLSILVGSFVGLEQRKLKSLLAYSSISHMGYLLIAFSTGTFEGVQMLFAYLIIYMSSGLCVWSIFVLTQLKNNYLKKQNKDLGDFILLKKSNSLLAFYLATALLSIAGLPPMIGFFVKIGIFLASVEASLYFIALISILCSVISTFFYLRIVKILYFEKGLVGKLYFPINTQKSIITVIFFYFFLFLFLNPTFLYLFSYKISLLLVNFNILT